MKKFLISAIFALATVFTSVAQGDIAVYESNSKLSFACPDNAEEIQDTPEIIQVQTPDLGFSAVAIPFLMDEYTEDTLAEALVEMAQNAGVDLSQANRLSFENTDIVGQIFAAKDEDGLLYVFGICGDNVRGFLLQVLARPRYHQFVDSMFETISIED